MGNQKIENKNQNEKMLRNAIFALAATIATTTSARMLKDKDGQDLNEDINIDDITEEDYKKFVCLYLCEEYRVSLFDYANRTDERNRTMMHYTGKLIDEQ